MTTRQNTEWIPQQIKVFSRWVSSHLSKLKTNVKVNDVTKDLQNGVALVELAEILTGKLAPRNWALSPKRTVDMVQNCDLAIEMFTDDGVQFVGISGKDINDNNQKLILGLVWTLILYYSIGQLNEGNDNASELSASQSNQSQTTTNSELSSQYRQHELIQWAINRTASYSNVKDFQPYDLSMCALLDSYVPEKINYNSINPTDKARNAELATNVMHELGIPVLLDSDDLQDTKVDEKSLLTQLSAIKTNFENPQTPLSPLRVPPRSPVSSPSRKGRASPYREEFVQIQTRDIQFEPELNEIQTRDIQLEPELNENQINDNNSNSESESESDHIQTRSADLQPEFVPHEVEGDNRQYSGRKFGLIMLLNESDYNDGQKMNPEEDQLLFGEDIQLALTLADDKQPYLNPAGRKLDIAHPDIENDTHQQFTFGKDEWSTVIDSFFQKGMVWDVSDEKNTNPPAGTPFYLFPFHGRHNQHFVYKDNMIYAKQNGHVVTYVGGEQPLVMMPPSNCLKARQTFSIKFI